MDHLPVKTVLKVTYNMSSETSSLVTAPDDSGLAEHVKIEVIFCCAFDRY